MNKLTLLFLFACALFSAQMQRFTYEYKFIPDSTNRADVKKEMMLLDIDKKGSSYYSLDKSQQDSLVHAQIQKQISEGGGNINIKRTEKKASTEYKVSKVYPEFKTFLTTSLGQDKYKIAEDQKIVWKVLPDKQKIGSYDAQKATTSFGGREWTAWFSTELPFQDGPYKFYDFQV
jgi:GLPGLI family protein